MSYQSINPFNGKELQSFETFTDKQVESALQAAEACYKKWRLITFAERATIAHKAAASCVSE